MVLRRKFEASPKKHTVARSRALLEEVRETFGGRSNVSTDDTGDDVRICSKKARDYRLAGENVAQTRYFGTTGSKGGD
jgi:hypothetical protein